MDTPILSIIIPVYNLESYVRLCLDSVYSQQVDELLYEVIAIDDGSGDASLERLKEYACTHSNLHVVSQKNGGVSVARNRALEECRGKYITFLDGDDELHSGSIQAIIDAVSGNNDFDIMYCRGFKRISGEAELHEVHAWKHLFNEGSCYADLDLAKQRFINGGSVCGGVFRKDFFVQNHLQFAEGVANGEDTIFTYLMYARHPRVIFRDIKLNVINVREGSATHNCTMERVRKIENNLLYLLRQRTLYGNEPSVAEAIDKAAYHSIMLAIEMYLSVEKRSSLRELCKILHIGEIRPLRIHEAPLHQRVKSFLLNLNFALCVRLIELENWKNGQVNRLIKDGENRLNNRD